MGSKASTQVSFFLSILFSAAIAFYVILCLVSLRTTVSPEIDLNRIALCLFLLFLPILGGWHAFQIVGGLCFGLFSLALVIFIVSVTNTQLYLWFILEYLALILILHKGIGQRQRFHCLNLVRNPRGGRVVSGSGCISVTSGDE